MMKLKSRSVAFLAALLLSFLTLLPASVLATEPYTSYQTGDDAGAVAYDTNWFAQTFTPLEAFIITEVNIRAYKSGSPEVLTVSIREVDDTGKPTGVDLTSNTYNGLGTSAAWHSIQLSPYPLENEQYAIVVRATAGDVANYVVWRYNDNGVYTEGSYASSTDGGNSWSLDTSNDFMFVALGEPVLDIIDCKVFTDFLEDGDWLVTVHYLNEYPPYYLDGEDVTSLFDLQFLTTNGTLIADVRVPTWGCMPGAVYLSSELAAVLEWGGDYIFRIQGRFDPYPSVNVTLSPLDWLGSDLGRLDSWVLGVAHKMATYYDTAMTDYYESAEVLNEVGGVFFVIGIPMLVNVRPHLFLDPGLYIPYDREEWDRAYEEELYQWRERVGDKIADDAAEVGNIFNLEGNQVAAAAFVGTWIVVGVGTAAVAGAAALVVSIPFVVIGLVTGVLPMTVMAIVASLFVLALVLYTWISKG